MAQTHRQDLGVQRGLSTRLLCPPAPVGREGRRRAKTTAWGLALCPSCSSGPQAPDWTTYWVRAGSTPHLTSCHPAWPLLRAPSLLHPWVICPPHPPGLSTGGLGVVCAAAPQAPTRTAGVGTQSRGLAPHPAPIPCSDSEEQGNPSAVSPTPSDPNDPRDCSSIMPQPLPHAKPHWSPTPGDPSCAVCQQTPHTCRAGRGSGEGEGRGRGRAGGGEGARGAEPSLSFKPHVGQ